MATTTNLADALRMFVRSGQLPCTQPWGVRLDEALRFSMRQGLDTRGLASSALDAVVPVERRLRIYRQARQAAVMRIIIIVALCGCVRLVFGAGFDVNRAESAFFIIWILVQSVILAVTFDDFFHVGFGSDAGKIELLELVRGYLTLGQLTGRDSALWPVMRQIRRDELMYGTDGCAERARAYLDELRRLGDDLSARLERSRWQFMCAEIGTAVVTFFCFDGLPIIHWLENSSRLSEIGA